MTDDRDDAGVDQERGTYWGLSDLLLDALRKGHTVEIDRPEGGGYRFVIDGVPLTDLGWGDWERFTVPMESLEGHLTDDASELIEEVYAEDAE